MRSRCCAIEDACAIRWLVSRCPVLPANVQLQNETELGKLHPDAARVNGAVIVVKQLKPMGTIGTILLADCNTAA